MRNSKRIILRAVALLLLLAISATALCSCGKKPGEVTVAKTENFTVTAGMLAYSLYDTYYYYINYYGEDVLSSYFGLDTSLSLRDQYYNKEEGQTWFDIFLEDALYNGFVSALSLCEAALKDGIELNSVDNQYINNKIEEIAAMAKEEAMTTEEYIEALYGKGVTEQDIRESLKIYRLANKKLYKDYELAEVTDEDIDKYVSEDPDSYLCRDVKYFILTLSNEAEKNAEIKTYAEKIASAKTEEDFETYVNEFLASEYCVDKEEKLSSQYYQNKGKDDDKTEFEKWLFAEDTAVGATYLLENSTNYTVYMTTSEPALDSSETRNIYHILFSGDIYNGDTNAETLANNVYNEWKNGGGSLERFKELAFEYTTDYASAYTGGYYANVAVGDLIEELDEWLFDERNVGDSAVIKTDYGFHIIYYAGEGEPYWKVPVIQALKDEVSADLMEEYDELYQVEVFDNKFKYVP